MVMLYYLYQIGGKSDPQPSTPRSSPIIKKINLRAIYCYLSRPLESGTTTYHFHCVFVTPPFIVGGGKKELSIIPTCKCKDRDLGGCTKYCT